MELLMATITMSFSDHSDAHEPITVSLSIGGNGLSDHFTETFKAFCVACGYHQDTADEMLDEWREEILRDEWAEDARYDEALEEMNSQMDADQHPFTEHDERDFFDERGRDADYRDYRPRDQYFSPEDRT